MKVKLVMLSKVFWDSLNLKELLMTCDNENIASIKTKEKNGGELIEKKNDQDGRLSRYY